MRVKYHTLVAVVVFVLVLEVDCLATEWSQPLLY